MWTECQLEKLTKWIDEQMQLINSEMSVRWDGEPTGIFDKNGNPGKIISKEEGEIYRSLAKERIEQKLKQAGITRIVDLTVTYPPCNPRLPGHSNFRVTFCVGGEVPYMFR